MSVIILSTGHTFLKESVKCITPIRTLLGYDSKTIYDQFTVIGVGFSVDIILDYRPYGSVLMRPDPYSHIIRQEFIDSLLG